MNKQIMNKYLDLYRNILNKYNIEIQKLHSKQEELNRREHDILTIKDNTNQILKILLEQQEKKIQSLNKAKEIKHNSDVWSITELSDLRIATGDGDGYLTLFTVDYANKRWTKIKEEKGHNG